MAQIVITNNASVFDVELIRVTPRPLLPALGRYDYRMAGFAEMLRGMFVFRGVAAKYRSASLTGSKVEPLIPHFDTFLAYVRPWRYGLPSVEMLTKVILR